MSCRCPDAKWEQYASTQGKWENVLGECQTLVYKDMESQFILDCLSGTRCLGLMQQACSFHLGTLV